VTNEEKTIKKGAASALTPSLAASSVTSRSLAWRLWKDYLSRYWPRLALSLIAIGVYAASASAIPLGVEWINAGFAGGTSRFSPTIGQVQIFGPMIIIALGAVNATAQYFQTRLSLGAALSTLRDIQNDMFSRLMALDFAQQRQEVSGQIISRFTNDTMVLRETLRRASNALRDILTLVGLCAMMLWYDWALFLVVILIYPLIGIPVARIGKVLRKTSSSAQAQTGDVTALIGETVTGARMVKSYQLEPLERTRAADAFEERLRLHKKMAYARALNEPFIFFAGSIAMGLVIAVVAMRISNGALSTAEFISFIIALLLLSQPARGLGTLHAVMQEGFGAFERIISLIDTTPEITNADGAVQLPPGPGAIRIDDVKFAYEAEGANALDGVSVEIRAGSMIALVGASGSGKSTLLNLLPRLYEPESGYILIDGTNIADVTLRSLRARIALVSQDAILFNMSALENIAFGRPGASRPEIVKAATDAAANDFISLLPNGYDTPLGEGGAKLSGGQRQRIALARAFLKDAPILLLDEATSALDAESETKIQDALKRLTKERTTLVIAHRLSTVKDADLIIVLDKGRIIETGQHEDLMAKGGIYAKQAALQFSS